MAFPQTIVYILKNGADPARYYTGLTSNLPARLAAHNAGRVPHTASAKPWTIDVSVEFADERRATSFEKYLKSANRAALGARGGELARIVLGEAARLVAIGLAIGLGLVWAGANTIRAFLFGVQPLDVATLTAAVALILMLAVIMSLRPAMRAARVDLGTVLRGD